ncbi:hypothetical protein BPA01_04110 [Brevibacillus parabrevis]|uniref:Uncharacterized protein n=1 Tax=Brevibacillus parabrevis TaxID=54914 RepID=A0A4Y3PK58_BREPA|nr:hypothetical protein BPA01_04110 [Brevibacillus parabrevis]
MILNPLSILIYYTKTKRARHEVDQECCEQKEGEEQQAVECKLFGNERTG